MSKPIISNRPQEEELKNYQRNYEPNDNDNGFYIVATFVIIIIMLIMS